MNSKLRIVFAGAACMAACAIAGAQSPSLVAPQGEPTGPSGSQVMGPPPSHDYVWMAGHWNSESGQWKWVAGHWDLPPNRSAIWVAGHWIQGSSGWTWMNGAWNVAEAPQSPGSPPTPPGENQSMVNGQGMPMPSTPAPNVQGQYYAQGGQVPVAYQGESVTDYGPVDYSVASPGYYWTGDAWAWGIYPGPFYFGLGFGPRFFGGGRGFGHFGGRFGHGGAHGFGHVGGHFR
jgi:hypothetical protein